MKKRMAVGMLTALLALASVVGWGGRVSAEQVDTTSENAAQAEPTDDWLESQKEIMVSLHWLTKSAVGVRAVAAPLTQTSSSDGMTYTRPLDDRETTFVKMLEDTTLRYESPTPFERIYVKLEFACRWTVKLPDGTEKQGGKDGFIHELMELEQSVTSFELHLPKGARLTDIYAFTAGKLPSWVQVWEPPCENADFLVLPTHADDEHLWFGGAMPYYAGELGYKVQVVYMTNHYNQNVRSHELLNGLWTVGVRHYPIISDRFDDIYATKASVWSAAKIFGRENVLAFQVEILRRFSPKVVIAHDINGEYGHGAHILNAQTVLEALPLTDDPSAFPESAQKYGTCKVQKCYLHLWTERPIVVDWRNMPLARFDDVSALEMAVKGFHCHVSQFRYSFHVADSGRYDCRKFGLAYTTVGDDTPGRNDMLEHIVRTESKGKAEGDAPAVSGEASSEEGTSGEGTSGEGSSGEASSGEAFSGEAPSGEGSSGEGTANFPSEQTPAETDAAGQVSDGRSVSLLAKGLDWHDDRTIGSATFLLLAGSGIVCALTVTAYYAKRS